MTTSIYVGKAATCVIESTVDRPINVDQSSNLSISVQRKHKLFTTFVCLFLALVA